MSDHTGLIAVERHLFSVQNSVVHVVNVEFSGLYGYDDLPSYFKPPKEAKVFGRKIIDRVLTNTDTEFVFSDNSGPENCLPLLAPGHLSMIIAPKTIELEVGGRTGSNSWLWDKGLAGKALVDACITTEDEFRD